MSIVQAVILGLVQGLTEFIPVSSSGHLVIFQHLLGLKEPPLFFDVMVHVGTLLAVIAVFWEDVLEVIKRPFSRLTLLIVIGCIPAGLMGFFLEAYFEKAFSSLLVVGVGLIITGVLLLASEYSARQQIFGKNWSTASLKDAFLVGIMQGIAITPGISRSGSTIAGSLFVGLDREYAARFSFLLSIPVIIGAALMQAKDLVGMSIPSSEVAAVASGTLVAAVSGYVAIKLVVGMLKRGRLSLFAWYCWVVAIAVLAWHFIEG